MGASAPQLPKYNPPKPPAYQPLDINAVNAAAIAADQSAYAMSDTDFQQRYPQLAAAQYAFQKQAYNDVTNPMLPPAVQNQMMGAGLQQAAQSMGATGAFGTGSVVGTPGSKATAGQSAVARNFGLNVANYLQQQKQVGASELAMSTSMLPRRDFGIGGQGVAQAQITENTNQNNYNWGVYASQVQAAQFQANMGAQQAGLSASAKNASTGSMMSMGGAALGAVGAAVSAAI